MSGQLVRSAQIQLCPVCMSLDGAGAGAGRDGGLLLDLPMYVCMYVYKNRDKEQEPFEKDDIDGGIDDAGFGVDPVKGAWRLEARGSPLIAAHRRVAKHREDFTTPQLACQRAMFVSSRRDESTTEVRSG